MAAFWLQKNINMFQDGISLPRLTLGYVFNTLKEPRQPNETQARYLERSSAKFCLFGEKDKDIDKMLERNRVGGPAIVTNRYHEVRVTRIRDHFTWGKKLDEEMRREGLFNQDCV